MKQSTALGLSGLLLASTTLAAGHFPIMMMATPAEEAIAALEEKRDGIFAQSQEILDAAEDGDISDDDLATIEANKAEVEKIDRLISARKAMLPVSNGRKTSAEPQNRGNGNDGEGRRTVPATPRNNDPKAGFKNFGEFAMCVKAAGGDGPDGGAVTRLQNALTTYGNEGSGADGGFLVPPDFRRDIAVKVMGEESLIARTDRMVTSSNSLVLPKDETTPYGSTGIQAYWESEAGQKTQSKPVLGQNALRLNKLIALVPVTDELLEDAPAIDSYLRRKTPEVMTAKLNTAIFNGTGVGQPLGFLKSPSLITVAKESGQAADSILYANIVNMYSRMRAGSLPNSVWLINQSILPQLLTMAFDPGATAGKVPVFLPASGAAGAPYGTLLGRPILPIEAASALGDLGDINFVDLSQYLTATKGNDIKTDVSIHLFFDYDVTAFRFVFRVTGQPWWNSPVTPQASGAATLGQFITLAERA